MLLFRRLKLYCLLFSIFKKKLKKTGKESTFRNCEVKIINQPSTSVALRRPHASPGAEPGHCKKHTRLGAGDKSRRWHSVQWYKLFKHDNAPLHLPDLAPTSRQSSGEGGRPESQQSRTRKELDHGFQLLQQRERDHPARTDAASGQRHGQSLHGSAASCLLEPILMLLTSPIQGCEQHQNWLGQAALGSN